MTVSSFHTEDLPTKDFDPKVTRELLGYLRPYAKKVYLSLALMAINSAAVVAGPYLVKIALDEGIAKGSVSVLQTTVLIYALIAFFQWFAIYSRVYIMSRVGQSIIYDIREKMFAHLQRLSLSFYTRFSVGRIIVRLINDVNVLREFITWAMLAIARDVFTLVGIIISMLIMNPRLSLLAFSVLPVMVFITYLFRRKSRHNYRESRAAISWVNSVLAENINGMRVIQAFSREDTNYQYFKDTVNRNNLDVNVRIARLSALFFPGVDFLGTIAMALVIWLGGVAVIGDEITPGLLVAFVLYINRFFDPIRDLSRRFDTFQSTMASGERISSLLTSPIEIQDHPNANDLPAIKGEIEFEHVSFHYADDPTSVLRDINISIDPGETVALVGKTGAGKTTFIKLVARFHDPSEGQIQIDGFGLKTITQHSLRQQMGIVLQDPFLFSGSVYDNILFGRISADKDEVIQAAKAVGAHEFIIKLAQGYDTLVEEGGAILSVGQRQLISFARALLANPRILILDEATSSVDTQTELKLQAALSTLLSDRTSIVIAHRLSTIVNSDRILVIDDGQIIEEGSHQELLAQKGKYFELYSLRFEEK